MQLDEQWSFVTKKQKHCAGDDDLVAGDPWGHVALDPDSRLVLSVVAGKRILGNAEVLLTDGRARLGGRVPEGVTSDEYPASAEALLAVFGEEAIAPRTGRPGRPAGPRPVPPPALRYATGHTTRANGRVVRVESREVFGAADGQPPASTSYLERQNATDRRRNARKGRKTYRFSKDWDSHAALTAFTMDSSNFCWPARTLRVKGPAGRWHPRTPAMAAARADHGWTVDEWLTLPCVQR